MPFGGRRLIPGPGARRTAGRSAGGARCSGLARGAAGRQQLRAPEQAAAADGDEQARWKSAAEPGRSVTVAVPASAVEVTVLIVPRGVNTSVNELSGEASASASPCQAPCRATTQPSGSGFGAPPVISSEVFEPLVFSQAFTCPVSWNVYVWPLAVQSRAVSFRLSQPNWLHAGSPSPDRSPALNFG